MVTVTHGGYVKRNPKTLYRAQRRGGRGITGAATHEEDFVAQLFVASTHDDLLMLTNKGRAYSKKIWEVPQAGRTAKGKAFVNLIPLQEASASWRCCRCASSPRARSSSWRPAAAYIKKTSLDAFANIRSLGIIALTIADDDDAGQRPHHRGQRRHPDRHAQRAGRFASARRTSARWAAPPAACAASACAKGRPGGRHGASVPRDQPATLLTVCERGYGKRTPASDYPTKGRGGKGVITIKTTERNGKVVSLRLVSDDDDLMLITDGGKVIRMPVDGIPTIGRNTQGVRLIRLETGREGRRDGAHGREGRGRRRARGRARGRGRARRAAGRSRWQAEDLARRGRGRRRRRRRGGRRRRARRPRGRRAAVRMATNPGSKRPRSTTLFERA